MRGLVCLGVSACVLIGASVGLAAPAAVTFRGAAATPWIIKQDGQLLVETLVTVKNDGEKVVRGGSWYDRLFRCTSSFRPSYPPWQRVYNVGFRVVCEAREYTPEHEERHELQPQQRQSPQGEEDQ